jgi:predicted nucleotidyltransferase
MSVKPEYKTKLLQIIHKYIPGCVVYLFGSRATGRHQSGSDIDLALDAGGAIPLKTLLAIQNEIDETTIPLFVDLLDLCGADENITREVYSKGLLWTQKPPLLPPSPTSTND